MKFKALIEKDTISTISKFGNTLELKLLFAKIRSFFRAFSCALLKDCDCSKKKFNEYEFLIRELKGEINILRNNN